ncbi:MAG: flagellar export chaperone FlgN [Planctomycetota bacterium]
MTETTESTGTTESTRGSRLVSLLDQQIDLYGTLDELSKRQHDIVETDDTDSLLRVLAERQSVINRIANLARALEPFRSDWDANVNRLPDTERVRIRARLDELAIVMEQIARRDEHDRDVIEQRRSAIGQELGGAKRTGVALSAYGGQARGPRFQDREA